MSSDEQIDLPRAREILDSVIDELTDGSLPPEVREAIVNEIENVASTLTAEVKGWFDDWMGD